MHSIFIEKYFLIFFEEEQSVSVAKERILVVNDSKPEVGTKVLVKYGKKTCPACHQSKRYCWAYYLIFFIRIIKFCVMTDI